MNKRFYKLIFNYLRSFIIIKKKKIFYIRIVIGVAFQSVVLLENTLK